MRPKDPEMRSHSPSSSFQQNFIDTTPTAPTSSIYDSIKHKTIGQRMMDTFTNIRSEGVIDPLIMPELYPTPLESLKPEGPARLHNYMQSNCNIDINRTADDSLPSESDIPFSLDDFLVDYERNESVGEATAEDEFSLSEINPLRDETLLQPALRTKKTSPIVILDGIPTPQNTQSPAPIPSGEAATSTIPVISNISNKYTVWIRPRDVRPGTTFKQSGPKKFTFNNISQFRSGFERWMVETFHELNFSWQKWEFENMHSRLRISGMNEMADEIECLCEVEGNEKPGFFLILK
ncbi:hypothetical protein ABW20_dc0107895 [Dactylellina cionopaga]|nr:hypothetical protein ABW20_dc0107895 [Dactylellina cionopaga]